MKLVAGEKVPMFQMKDVFGREVKLESYAGSKIMISFYRFASCPFCNLRVHKLLNYTDRYEQAGLKLISFWQSPAESLLDHIKDRHISFPMIPDHSKVIYSKYGIENSWKGTMNLLGQDAKLMTEAIRNHKLSTTKLDGDLNLVPADFLINEDFTLHEAYYGKHIGDHIPFENITAFIVK